MKFFERKPKSTPLPTAETDVLRERYIDFCRNPFRSREQISAEYDTLGRISGVEGIAFYNNHTLMIGTGQILTLNPETNRYHDLGKFIIFIIRRYLNPEWRVQFRFANITHDPRKHNQSMHPHIKEHQFTEIGMPTGKLCITTGKYPLYQFIRKGEIHRAVPVFLRILRSYDPDAPWTPIESWPKHRWSLKP